MTFKKAGCVLLLVVFLLILPVSARAESFEDIYSRVEQQVGYDDFLSLLPDEISDLLEQYEDEQDSTSDPWLSITRLRLIFLRLASDAVPFFASGLILLVLLKLLSALSVGHERLTDALTYLAVISSGAQTFYSVYGILEQLESVTEKTTSLVTAALPVLSAAQLWSGSSEGAEFLSVLLPSVLTLLSSVASVFYAPLCRFFYAASFSGFFRDRMSLRPILSTVKNGCVRGVEVLSGLAVGVFFVRKASLSSVNTAARRSLRFALLRLLPVAGGTLTDGIETVYACGKSLCGRVGVICVISLWFYYAAPCLTGLVSMILYSSLATFGKVLGVPALSEFFSDLRDIFAVVTSFALCSAVVLSSALLILTGG